MEMLHCPNCNGGVTRGDRFCGYCRYPLIRIKHSKSFRDGIREALIPAVGSAVCGILGMLLFLLLAGYISSYYLGREAVRAVMVGFRTVASFVMMAVIMGGAMDLLLSGLCANSKAGRILCALGVTLVFCLTGFVLRIFMMPLLRMHGAVSPEIMTYAMLVGRGILPVAPLLQGALLCCADGCGRKKAVLRQIVFLGIFLVLSGLATILLTVLFGLGIRSLGLAGVGAAAAMLLSALLLQCFR